MSLPLKSAWICASLLVAGAAQAAPDLLTNEYTHDERCAADGEPFSLRSRTAFKRDFHTGSVDIEAGKARFSLWGSFMDMATVSVSGAGLDLRKLDTRNGAHNVAKGCPAEYATVTFELTSTSRIPGSVRGTLVVTRPGDTWRVPLDIHASPTGVEVQWDQFAGAPTTSTGSTRPITGGGAPCVQGTPGCPASTGSVQAPGGGPVSAPGGGSVTSHVFSSLKRCLTGQGGNATLDGANKLVVKVPRDRVVNCQDRIRADHRVTDRGVDIQARREDDQFQTRVTRSAPAGAFFTGATSAEEFAVLFQWDAIAQRFRPLVSTPVVAPSVGSAVENRVGSTRPALPGPSIEAEIEVKLNGRVHAPLLIRIEPAS